MKDGKAIERTQLTCSQSFICLFAFLLDKCILFILLNYFAIFYTYVGAPARKDGTPRKQILTPILLSL